MVGSAVNRINFTRSLLGTGMGVDTREYVDVVY